MEKKTIRDIDTKELKGKKVLVRCDFNVPLKDGTITDDTRIRAALPTIRYLLENGARVVLCSHLGRPKGEVNDKYSMRPVAEKLSEELDAKVKCAEDVTGPSAKDMANELKEGEAGLLENVRFDPREEKNEERQKKCDSDSRAQHSVVRKRSGRSNVRVIRNERRSKHRGNRG